MSCKLSMCPTKTEVKIKLPRYPMRVDTLEAREPSRALGTLRGYSLGGLTAALVVGAVVGLASSPPAFPQLRQMILVVAVGATVALVVLFAWYRPDLGVLSLVCVLPFNDIVLARFYALGIPARVTEGSRLWKELVVVTLVAWMINQRTKGGDGLDKVTAAFLAIVVLYVILPIGPDVYVRLLGARADAMFLVLFLVARVIPDPQRLGLRIELAVLIVGAIVSLIAFWNVLSPDSFEAWIRGTGLVDYRARAPGARYKDILIYGTTNATHSVYAGSIFLSAIVFSYYLLLPIGIALSRLLTRRLRLLDAVSGGLCVIALVLTQTRSAMAAALLMVVLALVSGFRKSRLVVAIVVLAVALVPLADTLNLGGRFAAALEPTNSSTNDHIEALRSSRDRISSEPFGSGLGSAGGISQRFRVQGGITNESWYLQIGTEVGVIGMLTFIWVLLFTLWRLWPRVRAHDAFAPAPLFALAGVAAGGLVLHTLADHATAWTLWILAGLALSQESDSNAGPFVESPPRVEARRGEPRLGSVST